MNEHNKDSVICAKYINIKTSLPVYEVVVELQHTELGVLVYEEPDVMRQVIRQARLTRRHLVRVVGDNVQLSESFIVDMGRRAVPTAVQYLTSRCLSTFVTVFPYAEFPSNFIVSANPQ